MVSSAAITQRILTVEVYIVPEAYIVTIALPQTGYGGAVSDTLSVLPSVLTSNSILPNPSHILKLMLRLLDQLHRSRIEGELLPAPGHQLLNLTDLS